MSISEFRPLRYAAHWLPTRRHQAIAAGAVAMALIGVVIVAALTLRSHTSPLDKINSEYSTQLAALQLGAKQLPPKIWPNKPVGSDLDDYDDLLYQMEGNCNELRADYPGMKQWSVPMSTKDAMNQVDQLCSDLLGVLRYSQAVYQAAHPYLVLDRSPWPPATQRFDYASRLNSVSSTANAAKNHLRSINTAATQDPALEELVTTVDSTLALTVKAQAAVDKSDTTTADQLASQVNSQLNEAGNEFLSARTYFWNNTIHVEKLRQAIDRLQGEFTARR
jgi:hypothetical protein